MLWTDRNCPVPVRGSCRGLLRVVSLVLFCLALPAQAQESASARYDISLLGAKFAELSLVGSATAQRYTVASEFKTTGLVGALTDIRFLTKASGRRSGKRFRPNLYQEEEIKGRKRETAGIVWERGIPRPTGENEGVAETRGLSLDAQGDAIDPLTAGFMVLRDQPRAGLCKINVAVFDGKRRTRLELGQPRAAGEAVVCTGRFSREAGYSAKDLAKARSWKMTVTYEPAGDLMRAVEIRTETLYGAGVITRR